MPKSVQRVPAQPFKDQIDRAAVRRVGDAVAGVWPEFARDRFVRRVTRDLADLELKARVDRIIDVLAEELPSSMNRAGPILAGAAGSLSGFDAWALTDYVGRHGVSEFEPSMRALKKLTVSFTAEFAIRPFLIEHTDRTLARLAKWTNDRSEHVRRLVSEGTRPRLPWATRLPEFQREPAPVIELLEKLKDDASEYVRRSVANNLNDIAKDHPDLVIDVATRWSEGAGEERRRLVKHACRTLIKAGHPDVFAVLGFTARPKVAVRGLAVSPKRIRLGDSVAFRFELVSGARRRQKIVIDYAVHHVKKNGKTTRKVFKLTERTLAPGEAIAIDRSHSIRRITTRTYYSGTHTVEVLVNGEARARADFELRV
ncbi:MAG: DNA alkylation repair protein [Planctomycetota bacterium]